MVEADRLARSFGWLRVWMISFMIFLPIVARATVSLEVPPEEWRETVDTAREFLGKLPAKPPRGDSDTTIQVELGRRLYFDRSISVNKTQSCNDCHPVFGVRAGVDNQRISKGALGKPGERNSPTVLNAAFQESQFWDGRAETLEQQAKMPVTNPVEMAMASEHQVEERLRGRADYEALFREAFPGSKTPVNFENAAKAISAFERTLITKSRFDEFMDGNEQALNAQEKKGLHLFVKYQCVQCHTGPVAGGQLFKKLGIIHPYKNSKDEGRFAVTKAEEDLYVFKVPMLRNITRTGPYFHNGRVDSLAEAVELMAYHQLDVKLAPEETMALVHFLHALSEKEIRTQGSIAGQAAENPAAELYDALCMSCHGMEGRGHKSSLSRKYTIPALWGTSAKEVRLRSRNASALSQYLQTHLPDSAPTLTTSQSAALAKFVMDKRKAR